VGKEKSRRIKETVDAEPLSFGDWVDMETKEQGRL
jgi:hypothetical protein